jgi:WXG100 family type VII secretion target
MSNLRQHAQPASGYPSSTGGGAATGGGFDTSLTTMDAAKTHIDSVGVAMTGQVDRLMTQLEALNPSTWDGDAYRQFQKAKLAWHQAHDHIRKALKDIEDCMHTSSKHYGQADLDSGTGIHNATSGIGG